MIKVGDRVRTTERYDNDGVELFPVGTIGTVGGMHNGEYMIEANGDFWWYTPDMFIKLEDKPMTRSDLEDGMIWERVEPRKMTHDEIKRELGYDFIEVPE